MIFKLFSDFRKCLSGAAILGNRLQSSQSRIKINEALNIEASLSSKTNHKQTVEVSSKELQTQPKCKASSTESLTKTAIKNNRLKNERKEKIIEDSDLGLQFSKRSERLNLLLTAIRSRKQFEGSPKIVIEGRMLISEALASNFCMNALFFSRRDQLFSIKDEVSKAQKTFDTKIFKVSKYELKIWSTLTTPPGLLAVFERPPQTEKIKQSKTSLPFPITVVCDNIREPNNLGSIIRTCAAVPCDQVIVMKGCCDPWESKTLQGGCGGQFHVVIRDDVSWDELQAYIPRDSEGGEYCVFIAESNLKRVLENANEKPYCYNNLGTLGAHNIIIIGGESHGISDEAYKFLRRNGSGRCIYIPLANSIDSLNVASALTLILYEFRTQILKFNSMTMDKANDFQI